MKLRPVGRETGKHQYLCSARTIPRVAAEETNFAKLWSGESKHVITMNVPEAARNDLLRFLPETDLPARLKSQYAKTEITQLLPEPSITPPDPAPAIRQGSYGRISSKLQRCRAEESASAMLLPTSNLGLIRSVPSSVSMIIGRRVCSSPMRLAWKNNSGRNAPPSSVAADKAHRVLILAPAESAANGRWSCVKNLT